MEWLAILIAVVAAIALMSQFGFYGFIAAMGVLIAWGYWRSVKRNGG